MQGGLRATGTGPGGCPGGGSGDEEALEGQTASGDAMLACSQPCVMATRRAASREANVELRRNTCRVVPAPLVRLTANEAPKRPQPVGWVAGETT